MAKLDMYDFKKHLSQLKEMRGRHTELITVYVPPGYDINKIINQLVQEQSTATNIKSTSTRKNVTTALEKMIQQLSLFKKVPENGMAIFSGNVSEQEGKQDFQVHTIIPPLPLSIKLYRCEKEFILEPLEEMLERGETYGLLVMDNGGATIGQLRGKAIETLKEVDSLVFGKFRAGGQSAARMERAREGLVNDFYKGIAKNMKLIFGEAEVKGIIVGGPGPSKENFLRGGYLDSRLQKKVIAVKDIGYTNEYGLHELVERSQDVLEDEEIAEEKRILKKFFRGLSKDGLVAYGEKEVRRLLEMGAVETVILSEELGRSRVEVVCGNCGWKEEKTVKMKKFREKLGGMECPECGSPNLEVSERKDLLKELAELAEEMGGEAEVVSTETDEGAQLAQLGGVAAMLRFKV